MVKSIINVRRSSICWRGRRELTTDAENQKIMVMTCHCRRRAIYRLLRSPSQTCHAKPKTQINRRRTLPASFLLGGMPTARKRLARKTSLRKVRTLWHCSRLRSVAFTYDWSWWYPSGNWPLQQMIWVNKPGAGYGQFEHKVDSLIAKFKEVAERSERLMLSRVIMIISAHICN